MCPVSCFDPPTDTVVLILRSVGLIAVSGPFTAVSGACTEWSYSSVTDTMLRRYTARRHFFGDTTKE